MSAMESKPRLQIRKTWQLSKQTSLLNLVNLTPQNNVAPKKLFLALQLDTNDPPLSILVEKPDFKPLNFSFNEILRKYIANALIIDIVRHHADNTWILELSSRQDDSLHQYFIIITQTNVERCVELYSQAAGASLVRWTSSSIFTKRRTCEPPNMAEYMSIFNEVLGQTCSSSESPKYQTAPEAKKQAQSTLSSNQQLAIQKIKRRIKTVRKSLNRQHALNRDQQSLAKMEQETHLLAQFVHQIKDNARQVTLNAEQTGLDNDLMIELDARIGVGKNIDRRYQEIKRIRRGLATHQEQLARTQQNLADLQQVLQRLRTERFSETELQHLLKPFHVNLMPARPREVNEATPLPYKLYRSPDGTAIKVGKGAVANDLLTKRAKANDFWIHAVGHSGSHVLVDGSKFRQGDLPARVFRDAAILALHYSKARESREGEVYCTRRAKISKKKGMPPGLWNVELADTVMVRYDEDELKAVLNQLEA